MHVKSKLRTVGDIADLAAFKLNSQYDHFRQHRIETDY